MACPLPMLDKIRWQWLPSATPTDASADVRKENSLEADGTKQEEEQRAGAAPAQLPAAVKDAGLASACAADLKGELEGTGDVTAAPLHDTVNSSVHGSDCEKGTGEGEACIEGNEGPCMITTDLGSWPTADGDVRQVLLSLHLTFGVGADASLRHHNVVFDVCVDKVPRMMVATSVDKMWAEAESCSATLELKTQVQAASCIISVCIACVPSTLALMHL
jgi:hypothetical protein